MLLNKSNLSVIDVAHKDPFQRAMHGIKINADGSTVASNEKVMLIISPVDESKVHFPNVGEQVGVGAGGIVLKLDHATEAMKNLPKSKNRYLQHVAFTKPSTVGNVAMTCITDGGRKRTTEDIPIQYPYPPWENTLKKVMQHGVQARACVNRKDLILLLKSIENACPDKGGDNPIYIEFGNGLLLRSENRNTGQRAIGLINAYKISDGGWLELSTWERKVFGILDTVKRVVRRIVKKGRD